MRENYEHIILWSICAIMISSVIFLETTMTSYLLFIRDLGSNRSVTFLSRLILISVVSSTLFYWIFFTTILHAISLLINVNSPVNFKKLLCLNGIGMVFILIALIVNKYSLQGHLAQIQDNVSEFIHGFENSELAHAGKVRLNIGYALYFIWGLFHTKRLYRLSSTDILILSLSSVLFIVILKFLKGLI